VNKTIGRGETSQRSLGDYGVIVCHWTIVVCYYGGCVPLAVIVCHWTIVVSTGGCVPIVMCVTGQ
jgi:hypothetical protein